MLYLQHKRTPSHSPFHSSSCSPNHHNNKRPNRRSTPFQSYQESIEIVTVSSHVDSLETQNCPQYGTLLTKHVSDGQTTFYTWLYLTTRTVVRHLTVKKDPSTITNTIPLSRYWKILPQKIAENKYPKPSSFNPMGHS